MFQSSPAPKGGRYPALLGSLQQQYVSILARPEGRALPALAQRLANHRSVSILARPEGRALPIMLR